MYQAKMRVRNQSGTPVAEFRDFRSFSYIKSVNEIGMLTFDLHGDHPAVELFEDFTDVLDYQVEVWLRDRPAGIAWVADFTGLLRDMVLEDDSAGQPVFRGFCLDPKSLLARFGTAYKSQNNRTVFAGVPVETVMNTLVKYNATSSGTTGDGRIRNVDTVGLSVEADGAYGVSIDGDYSYRRLHDVLMEITRVAPGDFDVVRTGAAAWQYRFYEEQLGSDRTADVKFSPGLGNMTNPRYMKNKINERTVAIVLGDNSVVDDDTTRQSAVRIPSYSRYEANHNSIEYFVDARNRSTDEMNAIGDASIWEMRADDMLQFEIMQTEACRYLREYFLGDLVKAEYRGINKELKIQSVTVSMDAGSVVPDMQIETREA